MEVKSILLCSAATPHPDGTFSLLRGRGGYVECGLIPAHKYNSG